MSSFFDRFKGKREPTSAEIAKERLQLVLVSDRTYLSPDKLEAMQTDILMVIKRYIEIDDLEVDIKFEQRDRKHYLVADIPLHRHPSYDADEPTDHPSSSEME
jgi:cell division topological specificity factor